MTDVLYIEDNANEADVFARLMRKKLQSIDYKIANSGTEMLQYLREADEQNDGLPRLILMDINMNGMNGFDVIRELRNNSRTRLVPIIAFSTSDSPNDVRKAYQLGVNAYLIKPGGYQSTGELLERTFAFWLADNIRSY
ncbi:CheY-like chemotaxis protein [Spirosoma oryzae]|uniref:CheY-like chemotaxis protein n=1 Tax=Spirosoma oryzae TaxID=1469603 RepID=A0A2T0SEB2_9BACT|nr:response regulator [Spirosoma oryzae]PRY31756.1 CheY-like chemotaxis protein [Spirosoma oryzae]